MTTSTKPTSTIETTTNVWDIFDIVQPLAGHAVVAHAGGVRLTSVYAVCITDYRRTV